MASFIVYYLGALVIEGVPHLYADWGTIIDG